MKTYLVDTNLILRFLTAEPEMLARKAREIFERCERGTLSLRILPLVVTEVVFVLSGRHYDLGRDIIARELALFLENPSLLIEERDALLLALRFFANQNIDFVDAYLAAAALLRDEGVASFDRDFEKVPKLELLPPELG